MEAYSSPTQNKPKRRHSLLLPRKHHLSEKSDQLVQRASSSSMINLKAKFESRTVKKTTLKAISKQIALIPNKTEKEKNSVGGLYSLFYSEMFDINLLLYYLDTKEESCVIETLVHILNTKFRKEMIRFLPQLLCVFLSKKGPQALQSFLLSNCKSNITFTLKLEWLINAFYPKATSKKNQKHLKLLLHLLRSSQIETRRLTIRCIDERTFDYKDYIERVNEFYACLLSIESIKAKTSDGLLTETKKIIGKSNKLIRNLRRIGVNDKVDIDQALKTVYTGFIMPIGDKISIIDDQEQYIITNIVEDKAYLCFSRLTSSKSISYSIPFECIEVKEGSQWNNKVIAPQEDEKENKKVEGKANSKQQPNQINAKKSLIDSLNLTLNPFSISREEKDKDIKESSLFRNFASYQIKHFILKTKADYCNEILIMQMITLFSHHFNEAKIPLRLTPFQIEALSESVVLIEQVPNAISLAELYTKIDGKMSLNTFFRHFFCNNFEEAQKNLVESLAAYCLVSYLVNSQEKISDNLLLDVTGQVLLKKLGNCFAPTSLNYSMFQLPKDILEIIDGKASGMFHYYKSLVLKGLLELKKHVEVFIKLIESELKCVRVNGWSDKDRKGVIPSMTERFMLTLSDVDIVFKVEEMLK